VHVFGCHVLFYVSALSIFFCSSFEGLNYFISSLEKTNRAAVIVTAVTILFLCLCLVLKKRYPNVRVIAKFPAILVTVILGTAISHWNDLSSFGIKVLGHVDDGYVFSILCSFPQ
jgi:MFS superfamily sulfate permease-like transporter